MSQTANKMATRPMFPLLMSMALPPMLSMLLSSLYNIVDSMFVARYSADALTAVSLAFRCRISRWQSRSVPASASAATSPATGEGDRNAADSAVVHGLILAVVHYLFFVLLGLFAAGPFIALFTDSPAIRELGKEYLFIVLVGCVGQQVQIAIERCCRPPAIWSGRC